MDSLLAMAKSSSKAKLIELEPEETYEAEVKEGAWNLYALHVRAPADITVSVQPLEGDPDLFLKSPKNQSPIALDNYTWKSAGVGGDTISVFSTDRDFMLGTYVVGVYGETDAQYTIRVDIVSVNKLYRNMVKLSNGSQVEGSVQQHSWSLYTLYVNIPSDITVSVMPVKGDPDLFVNSPRNTKAISLDNNTWKSAALGSDTITIFATDREFCLGTFVIGVYGQTEAIFMISAYVVPVTAQKKQVPPLFELCAESIWAWDKVPTSSFKSLEPQAVSRLYDFYIHSHKMNLSLFKALNASSNLPTVTLDGLEIVDDEWIKAMAGNQTLQNMNLRGLDELSSKAMKEVEKFSTLNLVSMDLSNTRSVSDLSLIAALASYPYTLKSLTLASCTKLTGNALRKGVAECQSLTSLDISNIRNIQDDDLKAIGSLGNLTSLNIARTGCGGEGILALSGLTGLKVLDTQGCVSSFVSDVMSTICTFDALESLGLASARINDDHLMGLIALPNLARLDLSETTITNEAMSLIKEMPALTYLNLTRTRVSDINPIGALGSLQTLLLSNTKVESGGDVDCLKDMQSLTELDLSNCEIKDSVIFRLEGLQNLHKLNVANNRTLSDRAMFTLAKGVPVLASLDIQNTNVTKMGLSWLNSLDKLTELKLSHQSGAKAGVPGEALTAVAQLHRLTSLELLDGRISDDDVMVLSSLQSLKHLKLERSRIQHSTVAQLRASIETLTDFELVGQLAQTVRLVSSTIQASSALKAMKKKTDEKRKAEDKKKEKVSMKDVASAKVAASKLSKRGSTGGGSSSSKASGSSSSPSSRRSSSPASTKSSGSSGSGSGSRRGSSRSMAAVVTAKGAAKKVKEGSKRKGSTSSTGSVKKSSSGSSGKKSSSGSSSKKGSSKKSSSSGGSAKKKSSTSSRSSSRASRRSRTSTNDDDDEDEQQNEDMTEDEEAAAAALREVEEEGEDTEGDDTEGEDTEADDEDGTDADEGETGTEDEDESNPSTPTSMFSLSTGFASSSDRLRSSRDSMSSQGSSDSLISKPAAPSLHNTPKEKDRFSRWGKR